MLTDTEKAQVRLYLGYPDHFRYKHTRLETVLENLSPEAEIQVQTALAKIVVVEDTLLEAGTIAAGIKRADDIWFFEGYQRLAIIRKMGRQYVSRISIVTGVPIYSDVFGATGYLGDSFSGLGGPRYGAGSWYNVG